MKQFNISVKIVGYETIAAKDVDDAIKKMQDALNEYVVALPLVWKGLEVKATEIKK